MLLHNIDVEPTTDGSLLLAKIFFLFNCFSYLILTGRKNTGSSKTKDFKLIVVAPLSNKKIVETTLVLNRNTTKLFIAFLTIQNKK